MTRTPGAVRIVSDGKPRHVEAYDVTVENQYVEYIKEDDEGNQVVRYVPWRRVREVIQRRPTNLGDFQ